MTMKCFKCGSPICEVRRDYEWFDKFSGRVLVPVLDFTPCDTCGEVFFDPAACDRIADACEKKLCDWLENRPIKDFWDSQQVTDFLGITRQALSKSFQYRKLVYRLERNGKHAFLIDSVRQFKRTGDGRIPLESQAETEMPAPRVVTAMEKPAAARHPLYPVPNNEGTTATRELREKEAAYA